MQFNMWVLFLQKKVSEIPERKKDENLPLSKWNHWYRISDDLPFHENLSAFVSIDNDVITFEFKSNLKIVWEVQKPEETISNNEVVPTLGIKDAQQNVRLLSVFYESQIEQSLNLSDTLKMTEQKLFYSKNKQKNIQKFFFSEYALLAPILSCYAGINSLSSLKKYIKYNLYTS